MTETWGIAGPRLGDLLDVRAVPSSADDGKALKLVWGGGNYRYELGTVAGSGGAEYLDDLLDVVIASAATGEYLRYSTSRWRDSPLYISDDTAPTLGGALDVATFEIKSVSGRDIAVKPDSGGALLLQSDSQAIERASTAVASSTGSVVYLRKSRGSHASPAAVNNADTVGDITWEARGNSTMKMVARIRAKIASTYTSDYIPCAMVFDVAYAGTIAEALEIAYDGTVWAKNNFIANGTAEVGSLMANGDIESKYDDVIAGGMVYADGHAAGFSTYVGMSGDSYESDTTKITLVGTAEQAEETNKYFLVFTLGSDRVLVPAWLAKT